MKKRICTAAILLLYTAALLMQISGPVAAAEKISVTEQTATGSAIRFSGTAPGSKLFAAYYDLHERMLGVEEANKSGENFTVSVPSANTQRVNLFALDSRSKPMADAGRMLIVAEEKARIEGGSYDRVIITSDVGNGDVTLNGVSMNTLIVAGGGENSIHLEHCEVDAIQVDKDTTAQEAQQPRIELNQTPVPRIEAVQPVIIEADAFSAVEAVEAKSDVTVRGKDTKIETIRAAAENVKLTVEDAAVEKIAAENPVTIEAASEGSSIKEVEAQSDVIVQGAATKVDKVTIPISAADSGVELKIKGAKVAEIAAEKPVTIEATAGASPVEKVEAKDNLTVKGNAARIEQIEVPDTAATQPVIEVQTGTVFEIKADKPAKVKGKGTVTNVKANAEAEVASETVATITVTVQVTVTVTGDQPVEVAVETANAVSVVTANTNVSVSTTLTEEVNVVIKETESAEGVKVAHVHKWVEDTAQHTASTCAAAGKRVYVCGGAGECDADRTKIVSLPMLPHTEQILPALPATCTGTGATAGKICHDCSTELVAQQPIPALGHDYAAVWSSDSEGHWHECTRCGGRMGSAAHTPGAAATETADQACTVCGYVITPATGHRCASHLTKTAARAATCTAAGNSEYYTCTCGKLYSDANAADQIEKDSWILPATGHAYGAAAYGWKAVSGGYTCTATRICANNENHKETETVTASYAVTVPVACETVGKCIYTADFEGDAFDDQLKNEDIAALGHSWAAAWSADETHHWHVCTRDGCTAIDGREGHSWDAGVITTPAVGTQNGVRTYTCTVCAATKTEEIPASYVRVSTAEELADALKNDAVAGVCINADITVPAQERWTMLDITKPVIVAEGKTLTVAGYTTDGDKFGFLANDLTVVEGGSLTLGTGAVLKTTAIRSGENEPFYNYTGRVCVVGGTLDVSEGTVADGSFFNFNYVGQTWNSDALILGENMPEIEFSVHNDAQLRAAIADRKCTGGVIVEDSIVLENDLTVTKLVLVNDPCTLTVPAGKTLTVAHGGTLQISGTLNVYGTLNNEGEIFNLRFIDVLGGTLSNSGVINGSGWPDENGRFFYASSIGVENGAIINNFIGEKRGAVNDCIVAADYYRADGTVKQCHWNVLEGDHTFDPVFEDGQDNPNFDVMAVGFGTEQVKTALNAISYWGENNENSAYTYEYVLACGTAPWNEQTQTTNVVELGGISVRSFGTLMLKDEVFDGADIYRNTYAISAGNTLALQEGAALGGRSKDESNKVGLIIDGEIVNNGGFIDFSQFTVSGKNAPIVIRSEEELTTALENGGKIIIEGTEEFVQDTDDGRMIILEKPIAISKNTELINQFGNILYIPGLTIDEGAALTVGGMTVVLAADSTIGGTLNIGGDCCVMLRTPDEADGDTTELTVAEGGRIVIGGEDMSYWGAQLCNAEGENGGRLINNGTIDVYGDLWFDNVGGTVNYLYIAEVDSREALFAAMEDITIRQVVFTDDVTLLPGDAFQGRGMQYDIPENITVTLDWDEYHQDGKPIFLLQGATLRVNGTLVVNHAFYAYAYIETPEGAPREEHIVNENLISYMKNFADFGRSVYDVAGGRPGEVTADDIAAYKDQTMDEWPGGNEEQAFAFLVKYGGVQPWTNGNGENRKYWPAHEPINYGQAKAILEKVWKAINGEQSDLPASVSLDEVTDAEHMDEERCHTLLTAFAAALPRQEDSRTSIVLIRDKVNEGDGNRGNDGMTIVGKTFTRQVTIICDPRYLEGDNWGGELRLVDCGFEQGVTIKMTDNVNFKVDFGNSCTGDAVIALPEGRTVQQCRDNGTNVELYCVKDMRFDTTNAFGDFNDWGHDETVSFTLNGLTITDEGEGAFGINARYDDNNDGLILTTQINVFAENNEVKISGSYSGKLRIRGNVDVAALALENGGFIEMDREGSGSKVNLGSNTILVNDDCGGSYSFTGAGTVIVPNQNQAADITVNGRNLGTPHVFGRNDLAIFFPLASLEGIRFTVEQGQYSEDLQRVPEDGWTALEFDIDASHDGKIHLVKKGEPWLFNAYEVRVTVEVADGCTVVYDTMMWKPVQMDEFIAELNTRLSKEYTLGELGITKTEGDLTIGSCKTAFEAILEDFGKTESINMDQIINDGGYWEELAKWSVEYQEALASGDERWISEMENCSPDNWTRHWNDLDVMLDALTKALGLFRTGGIRIQESLFSLGKSEKL